MKLTKSKLKQLIKEELSQLLESDRYPSDDEPPQWRREASAYVGNGKKDPAFWKAYQEFQAIAAQAAELFSQNPSALGAGVAVSHMHSEFGGSREMASAPRVIGAEIQRAMETS